MKEKPHYQKSNKETHVSVNAGFLIKKMRTTTKVQIVTFSEQLQMKLTWCVLLVSIGLGSSEEDVEPREDELIPFPEALKLIYPEFTLELDDIPLQLEDVEDLPITGEDLEAKRRNSYLRKILRRKRQKPDFLRELDDRSKFIKTQLPVTELRRMQKEKPNVRLIRIIRNKKLDDDQLATTSKVEEFFAPDFDSKRSTSTMIPPKEVPPPNLEIHVPSQRLQPPQYEFSPATTTTTTTIANTAGTTTTTQKTSFTTSPSTARTTTTPQKSELDFILQGGFPISIRSPRMNHVMDIQKRFNDMSLVKTIHSKMPELTAQLRGFIRDEVQAQICQVLFNSSPETCGQGYVRAGSARAYPFYPGYPVFYPSPYPYREYTNHGGYQPGTPQLGILDSDEQKFSMLFH
ncbi:uncharacterized protein LOC131879524 isoform X2 [Tigriopus californicus]|uniref:uncharacterized protein LOC131879524 isoform X2 n=1 Tax=Tigriopus californicus TaxID=6832 RepID=UPI0027DA2128|nr:uncharacterized protein LOC131879524 isoform X2 [Tigriopus californicus]